MVEYMLSRHQALLCSPLHKKRINEIKREARTVDAFAQVVLIVDSDE